MKAVLVINMPEDCNEEKCPICYDDAMCSYLNRWIEDGKPNDCPLRPLPQKTYAEFPDPYKYGFADGWNRCLEEISK